MTSPGPAITNLADLAQRTGVSISTVSRALAGNPAISLATRERIAALADAHGFRPNQMARNLRLGRSRAVGVVLPLGHETGQHLTDPFFIALIGHLADALTERGHDLLLTRVIPSDAGWLDRLVDSGRIDGAIVIGQSNQSAVLERVGARYLPLVVWGARNDAYCTMGSDNAAGGAMAARHLIARGRQRIAFLGHPGVPEIGERWRGCREACAEMGVAAPELVPVHLTAAEAHDMLSVWLARGDAPDGLVAASDVVAMSALAAVVEAGLRVPADVAIVGFDDVTMAAHTTPPLTTVRQDVARGAALMVEHLFRRLDGEATGSVTLVPELVVRGSA